MNVRSAVLFAFCTAVVASTAAAQVGNGAILDKALRDFRTAAEGWQQASLAAGTTLFWSLALLSLVWSMGQLVLRRAELGELFGELVRYVLFTGFWAFMLQNGPEHARLIMDSMQRLGGNAAQRAPLSPSGVVDIGFHLVDRVVTQSSILSPVDSAVAIVLGLIILMVLALVAVNMLVLFVSCWFVAYGGLIILGFGACRWTNDMAINYYRMVLSLGLQVLAMALLVGAGQGMLEQYTNALGTTDISIQQQAVLLVVSSSLLVLVNRVPPLLGSLANGSSPHYAMGSGAGASAAMTATSTAMGAMKLASLSVQPLAVASAAGAGLAAFGAASALGDLFKAAKADGEAGSNASAAGGAEHLTGSVFPLPSVESEVGSQTSDPLGALARTQEGETAADSRPDASVGVDSETLPSSHKAGPAAPGQQASSAVRDERSKSADLGTGPAASRARGAQGSGTATDTTRQELQQATQPRATGGPPQDGGIAASTAAAPSGATPSAVGTSAFSDRSMGQASAGAGVVEPSAVDLGQTIRPGLAGGRSAATVAAASASSLEAAASAGQKRMPSADASAAVAAAGTSQTSLDAQVRPEGPAPSKPAPPPLPASTSKASATDAAELIDAERQSVQRAVDFEAEIAAFTERDE